MGRNSVISAILVRFQLLLVVEKTLVPMQESILPDGMLSIDTNSRNHTIPKSYSNSPRWAVGHVNIPNVRCERNIGPIVSLQMNIGVVTEH